MTMKTHLRCGAAAGLMALAGCTTTDAPRPQPVAAPPAWSAPAPAPRPEPEVRTAIVGGTQPVPTAAPPTAAQPVAPQHGDVTLSFPAADVRAVARSVEVLTGRPITVDPAVEGQVSLVTPGPVARTAVLDLFEAALRAANLGLTPVGEGYVVQAISTAPPSVGPQAVGYGTEVLTLQFIQADEMRKVLDGVLPGVVTATDPKTGTVTIVGTTGQRRSARDLIQQFDVNWLRNMSFALFLPGRTDSRLIVRELDKLINADNAPTRGLVRLIAMERLNGILAVTAQRDYLEDVRGWIEVLDREGESIEPRIFVYRVQNGRARDLANTINKAFGRGGAIDDRVGDDPLSASGAAGMRSDRGEPQVPPAALGMEGVGAGIGAGGEMGAGARGGAGGSPQVQITADEVNNAVVVYGTPRDYAKVEDALRRLDVAPYQVMIEAAITEVALTDTLRYGVQWNWLTGDSNFTLSEAASGLPTRQFPGFSYFLAGNDIDVTLNALAQKTNIKVVSAPKLMVLNNQTAALQVGDQVPVSVGSAVSVQDPGAPIVNSIEYRDTGVILKVTPRVNAGGLVLLDVSQEVSDVNPRPPAATSSTNSSPTISTRRISTSIVVRDGQVIALGGLFRNSQSQGRNGVPFLSQIPVIGSLFGDHNNTENRTELIVLLKPHVIRTPDDGRAVTEELRSKIRTLEPFRTEGKIP